MSYQVIAVISEDYKLQYYGSHNPYVNRDANGRWCMVVEKDKISLNEAFTAKMSYKDCPYYMYEIRETE